MADGWDKAFELRQQGNRSCPRCKASPREPSGMVRVCAFTSGTFSTDNWHCATINRMRQLMVEEGLVVSGHDESMGLLVLPADMGGFLCMTWSSLGRVSGAWHLGDDPDHNPLTLALANDLVERAWLS